MVWNRIEIFERLVAGLVQIQSGRFLFSNQFAGPEQVDESLLVAQLLGGMLKQGAAATTIDSNNVEKLRSEGLALALFIGCACPLGCKQGARISISFQERRGTVHPASRNQVC